MNQHKRMISSWLLPLFLIACSNEDEKKAGNAEIILDVMPQAVVPGQDMTLDRIRVWHSSPNNESSGVVTLVDVYEVELWVTLSGESKSRYTSLSGLKLDEEGNLYSVSRNEQPGSVVYRANASGFDSYTITGTDGLLTAQFPRYHSRVSEFSSNSNGAVSSNIDVDVATLTEGPWSQYPFRVTPLAFSRQRMVDNSDKAIKGRMGCLVRQADGTGYVNEGSYLFSDVELGYAVRGRVISQSSASGDLSGDDDSLWIPYTENWYVSGINILNGTIRTYMERSAPYYMARELPGVDSDSMEPAPSGVEQLIRTCNAAASGTGGTFALLSSSSGYENIMNSGSVPYCAPLAAAASNPVTARSIPLSGYNLSDGVTTCSAYISNLGVTPGTWNGSMHLPGSSISSSQSSLYKTGTEIVETDF